MSRLIRQDVTLSSLTCPDVRSSHSVCGSDSARNDRCSIAQEASVPEDQDTLTPARRRARRQDADAANDVLNGATEGAEGAEATETVAPKRRRSTRASAAEAPTLPGAAAEETPPKPRRATRATKASAASDDTAAPGDMTGDVTGDVAPAPKRRSARAKSPGAENAEAANHETLAAETAASEDAPRPRRAAT